MAVETDRCLDCRPSRSITTVIGDSRLRAVVTTWVERSEGGRARGPRGLARAWVEVLVRPGRFFRTGVAPGDQAPGLVFAVVVAVGFAATRLAVEPAVRPTVFAGPVVSGLVALAAVALLVAPAVLHLSAAVVTVGMLVASLRVRRTLASVRAGTPTLHTHDRAGVSETVQVLAYASAPGLLAGLPWPPLQLAATAYGVALAVYGLHVVHGVGWLRVTVAGLIPALLLFGVGFGGITASQVLFGVA